jgi:2,3-bisphosphoglycerate-independent phosphoglycerate mutase
MGGEFDKFDRGRVPDVLYVGIMEYDSEGKVPKNFLVEPPIIENVVTEYLAMEGIKMFAISETQKFGHVTYFWNGNKSGYINDKLETYIEIPSDRIPFDQAPEMKAFEITDEVLSLLQSGKFRFGRLNLANGDMVGHTGVMEAVIKAVETVDACVGRLINAVGRMGGITIVTADHGNADEMFTLKKGNKVVKTAHTLNPVPFAIIDPNYKGEYAMAHLPDAGLTNVAATICNLLGYEKPDDYEPSLIRIK